MASLDSLKALVIGGHVVRWFKAPGQPGRETWLLAPDNVTETHFEEKYFEELGDLAREVKKLDEIAQKGLPNSKSVESFGWRENSPGDVLGTLEVVWMGGTIDKPAARYRYYDVNIAHVEQLEAAESCRKYIREFLGVPGKGCRSYERMIPRPAVAMCKDREAVERGFEFLNQKEVA